MQLWTGGIYAYNLAAHFGAVCCAYSLCRCTVVLHFARIAFPGENFGSRNLSPLSGARPLSSPMPPHWTVFSEMIVARKDVLHPTAMHRTDIGFRRGQTESIAARGRALIEIAVGFMSTPILT